MTFEGSRSDRDLRVAFVHSYYAASSPSGENRVVDAEVAALQRHGIGVRLVSVTTDQLAEDPLYRPRAAARVATGIGRDPLGEIADFEPHVVHVHNLFPNYGRRWVKQLGVPVVHTIHNYRPICAAGTLFRDGDVCTLCPEGRWGSSFRYACYRGSRLATVPLTISNWGGPSRDPLISAADRIVMLSERQRDMYRIAGLDDDGVVVWPHFLPDPLVPDPRAPAAPGVEWLFVGRLSREKGIVDLLFRWPRDVPLAVVGSGPDEAAARASAAGKSVRFLGAIERREVIGVMYRSRGLVFSSRTPETFGLVYIEALACGLPVLAIGDNAVADAINEESTGATVGWDEDLPAVLEVAAQGFPSLHQRCRNVFERRYTERKYVRRASRLYRQLADVRSPDHDR